MIDASSKASRSQYLEHRIGIQIVQHALFDVDLSKHAFKRIADTPKPLFGVPKDHN